MMIIRKLWLAFSSDASRRNKILAVAAYSVLFGLSVQADEPLPIYTPELVQKNQSGPKYKVGDRIQLSIRLPLDFTYPTSSIQLKNLDESKPLDKSGIYLDPSPQLINGNLQFSIYPIQSGSLTLPELTLFKDENRAFAKTNPINFTIEELAQNPNEKPDLVNAVAIPLPFRFVIYGLLLISGLTVISYLAYKKFKPKPKIPSKPEVFIPPVPDHEIALRELNALFERFSYSGENLKPVAFGISQILKNYFSSRFKIDAKESTTDEMLDLLRRESIPSGDIAKIKSLFVDLDLIKFTDLIHHHHFQKPEFIGFRDQAKLLIEQWASKGKS